MSWLFLSHLLDKNWLKTILFGYLPRNVPTLRNQNTLARYYLYFTKIINIMINNGNWIEWCAIRAEIIREVQLPRYYIHFEIA